MKIQIPVRVAYPCRVTIGLRSDTLILISETIMLPIDVMKQDSLSPVISEYNPAGDKVRGTCWHEASGQFVISYPVIRTAGKDHSLHRLLLLNQNDAQERQRRMRGALISPNHYSGADIGEMTLPAFIQGEGHFLDTDTAINNKRQAAINDARAFLAERAILDGKLISKADTPHLGVIKNYPDDGYVTVALFSSEKQEADYNRHFDIIHKLPYTAREEAVEKARKTGLKFDGSPLMLDYRIHRSDLTDVPVTTKYAEPLC